MPNTLIVFETLATLLVSLFVELNDMLPMYVPLENGTSLDNNLILLFAIFFNVLSQELATASLYLIADAQFPSSMEWKEKNRFGDLEKTKK